MEHSSNLQNPQIPMSLPQPLWTFEDNQFFEHVLYQVDHASPFIYQDIASRMPWKSMKEIQERYRLFIRDLNFIHSGYYSQPTYAGREDNNNLEESSTQGTKHSRGGNTGKSYQWTHEEHQLFLMGLEHYGKGDWKSISMNCVRTKTPMQVASHAQKYFKRLNNPTPSGKRRYSIHDSLIDSSLFPEPTDAESFQMHQHNPPQIIETQSRPFSYPLELHPNPISNPCELPPNPNPINSSNTGEGLLVGLPPENNSASTTNEVSFLSEPLSDDWFIFNLPELQLDLFDDLPLPQDQQLPTK